MSYWKDLESIHQWKREAEHVEAQRRGKGEWYSAYRVSVTEVVRSYGRTREREPLRGGGDDAGPVGQPARDD